MQQQQDEHVQDGHDESRRKTIESRGLFIVKQEIAQDATEDTGKNQGDDDRDCREFPWLQIESQHCAEKSSQYTGRNTEYEPSA